MLPYSPFAPPIADPLPEPAPSPAPSPRPRPDTSPTSPNLSPRDFLDPILQAQPEPLAQPLPETDPCAERARQQRKKRSPRTTCWKGTYIEKASGLSKKRKVRVDCATGDEIAAGRAAPAPGRRRPRYNKPKYPGGLPLPDSWEIPTTSR